MRWFLPSWAGDFRFEPEGSGSKLVIAKPTLAEQGALRAWAKIAEKKGWQAASDMEDAINGAIKDGQHSANVKATVAEAGAEMAKILHWKRVGVLTAFAFADGRITATEVLPGKETERLEKLAGVVREKQIGPLGRASARIKELLAGGTTEPDELAKAALEAAGQGAKAAVTVKRPTLSCPECSGKTEAERMPCDVLWAFLNKDQQETWRRQRAVHVFGGLTGHLYRVAARDTAEAAKRGRIALDMDDMVILHNYDWTIPPEEEVLQLVLLLQHREDWLRVHGEVDPSHRASPGTVFDDPLAKYGDTMRGVALRF